MNSEWQDIETAPKNTEVLGYYSGRPCVVTGCDKPAGTAWGPHWCQQHNAERLNRIRSSLEKLAASPRSDGEGE